MPAKAVYQSHMYRLNHRFSEQARSHKGSAPFSEQSYQNRCWVNRLHQVNSTRSTEPLAARPTRSCRLLRSA